MRSIPLGLKISLGLGPEAIVMASHGWVYGSPEPLDVKNENDLSISLLIRYGNFHYILDGDLGAGEEACTNRETHQVDVQLPVAKAMKRFGFINEELGVDIMHVAHHGSESSTSAKYFNAMKPEVATISVGPNQGRFQHPRVAVVENILIGDQRPSCVKAPQVLAVFQTDDGKPSQVPNDAYPHITSFKGNNVGDFRIITEGKILYEISAAGNSTDNLFNGKKKNTFFLDEFFRPKDSSEDSVFIPPMDLNDQSFRHLFISDKKMVSTNFEGSAFDKCIVLRTDFSQSNFSNTELNNSNLTGSQFEGADFFEARLHNVDLSGADLTDANLTGAILCGVKLTGAKVFLEQLQAACIDASTELPKGLASQVGAREDCCTL